MNHGRSQDFFRGGGTFFENFQKISEENCEKFIILAYFFKKFNKPCVKFLRVWTKDTTYWKFWENFESFWWEFYRKIVFLFYFYFGKFVTKNRAFGNNTIYLQQFFRFRGDFPISSGLRPCFSRKLLKNTRIPVFLEGAQPLPWRTLQKHAKGVQNFKVYKVP